MHAAEKRRQISVPRARAPRDAVAVALASRVVAVHGPTRVPDARIVLPGGSNEQRERLPHVEPGMDEQLERVVEERESEPERSSAGATRARGRGRAARASIQATFPSIVLISPLWREPRKRLCALPARLGVHGEALVEDRRRPTSVGRRRPGRSSAAGRRAERLVGHGAERDGRDVVLDPFRAAARTMRAVGRAGTAHRTSTSWAMRGMLAVAVEPSAATSLRASRTARVPPARHASSTMPESHGRRRKRVAIPASSSL